MTEIVYAPARVWEEADPPVSGIDTGSIVEQTRTVVHTFGPVLGKPGAHLPNLELIAVIDTLMERLLRSLTAAPEESSGKAVQRIAGACHDWREVIEYWGWLSAYKMDRDR